MAKKLLKDDALAKIAQRRERDNVARFVSFDENFKLRHVFINGVDDDFGPLTPEEAAQKLLDAGAEFVNIRCFSAQKPDNNPFIMGRQGYETAEKIGKKMRALQREQLKKIEQQKKKNPGEEPESPFMFIINEEIDVMDGGFSGVLHGDVAVFAAAATPRCVEKSGCAEMPRELTVRLAHTVYEGLIIDIPYSREWRVEFSVHPEPVGLHGKNTIIWQVEHMSREVMPPEILPSWPNNFSEFIGDKAFGLLIAHLLGFPVPFTTVIPRMIPPFEFGLRTGSRRQRWLRTCPRVQRPGVFTTVPHWTDIYQLVSKEDPEHKEMAGTLRQDNVDALYSGACMTDAEGLPIIEGVAGYGDALMTGKQKPEDLPDHVTDAVLNLWERAHRMLGPVEFEWVYDKSNMAWIVQFHRGASETSGDILVPGEAERWVTYSTDIDIREFEEKVQEAAENGWGIILETDKGVLNHHIGQLRRYHVVSRRQRVLVEA